MDSNIEQDLEEENNKIEEVKKTNKQKKQT